MEKLTEFQLNKCEEGIESLATGLDVSQKDIVTLIEDGMKLNPQMIPYEKFLHFIDEMKATFDCY